MAMFIKYVQNLFSKYFKKEQNDENQVSRIEVYLGILYKLLVWEDPLISGLAILFTHVLFWFIVYFELRLYGIFFLLILMLFLLDVKFQDLQKQTYQTFSLDDVRQIVNVVRRFFYFLVTLRSEYPGTFCMCMCTGFLALSILGRTLSGVLLTYLSVLFLLSVPAIISRLPPEVLNSIRQTLRSISTNEGVVGENELLPSSQEHALFEKDADCESIRSDRTADSCTNSFISGMTSMPSYLEAEGSIDDLDEDIYFTPRNAAAVIPSNVSSDSSDSEHKDIKFEASHFNRDSSSSDEDSNYAQGLAFTEVDAADKPDKPVSLLQQVGTELLSGLGDMGNSILSSMTKKTAINFPVNVPAAKRSDSDSDFEIINKDEVEDT